MGEVKHRFRPELVALIVAMLVPTVLFLRWWAPRAAAPAELPALAFDARGESESMRAATEAAAHPPEDEREARRRELYLAQGLAEVRSDDTPQDAHERRDGLAAIAREQHEAGELDAARAADVERMWPALRGEGEPSERASEMGVFLQSLERWHALVEGRRVASVLVVRSLFVARWNAVHARPLTEGMNALERQGYHGWLAFHGESAPLDMRRQALAAYGEAGGADVEEAEAILLWQDGDVAAAADAFERAYAATHSVRLRNHALAAVSSLAAEL